MDAERFEALDGLITEVDALAGPTPEQVQQQQAEDAAAMQAEAAAKAWGMLPAMVGGMLAMWRPRLKAVYTPEACDAWGQAMNAVAEKRGWNAPTDAPELGLAVVTIGLMLPTVMEVRAGVAELKAAKGKQDGQDAPQDGQEAGNDGG